MKCRLVLVLAFFMFSSCSGIRMLNGTWEGMGDQIDGAEWSVLLEAKNRDIKISYPSLECGGEWRYVMRNGSKAELKELIIFGTDRCDQGVEVHVEKLSKTELKVDYYLREFFPDKPIATALLTKAK